MAITQFPTLSRILVLVGSVTTTVLAGRNCVQLDIPVTVTANNSRADWPRLDANVDVTDWVWSLDTWSHANWSSIATGNIPIVQQTFSINTQLCVPVNGSKSDILQLATHGIGFDKRYEA
jgi:hypothetical protein